MKETSFWMREREAIQNLPRVHSHARQIRAQTIGRIQGDFQRLLKNQVTNSVEDAPWRTHFCVLHRHSCRCPPDAETSLGAARKSACATRRGSESAFGVYSPLPNREHE